MKKIILYPYNKLVKEVIPKPTPVSVPNWFKEIPTFENNEKQLIVQNSYTNYTVKRCIPFLDSFFTGYTLNLWCDVQVRLIDGLPRLTWHHSKYPELTPVISRPEIELPIWENFFPFNFSWVSRWGIKTPKGYSCLFTHPLNRTDLPFVTTSGIMDTDKWGIWGNQPFALKKDWEGIIPAGTPIIQVIPFKRETWKSSIDETLTEWATYEDIRRSSFITGYYKKFAWSKKKYN
jgi:hypothetical protein